MNTSHKISRFPALGIESKLRSFSIWRLATAIAVGWVVGTAGLAAWAQAADERPVGVVDHRLVSQENWVKPWKTDWDSVKVAELLRSQGVAAAVIGLEALKDLDRLKSYRAILIPTDECYPDEGAMGGPLSRNLAAYVRAGGIYILPMGASHCRWLDLTAGAVKPGTQAGQTDFLGLQWNVVGDHAGPGPNLVLTAAGEKAGIPKPSLERPTSTHARAASPIGEVYVSNGAGQPCLVVTDIGKGFVIHYTGGLPLGPDVRDWLLAAYAAILKSGPDLTTVRLARLLKSQHYDLVPVAARREHETSPSMPGLGRQMTLTGGEDWELAEASNEFFLDAPPTAALKWTGVKMPNTLQHALFQAGQVPNPWFADNHKQLQWIQQRDWFLRRKFRLPENWRAPHTRLRFDGLDYVGLVWLDGVFLGIHEGMAGGPTFDASSLAIPGKEHELLVRLIHQAPGRNLPFASLQRPAIKSLAVDGASYQWGNRYRTLGIWQPVRLVGTGDAFLEAPLVRTERASVEAADLWAQAMVTNAGGSMGGWIEARIIDLETGQAVWSASARQTIPAGTSWWEQRIHLSRPKLWWPNGQGGQPLYRLELVLKNEEEQIDAITSRFGVRSLELRRNPAPASFPRSVTSVIGTSEATDAEAMRNADESYRFLFTVNGRPFYAKGACWLTSDDLLVLAPERESWCVRAAKRAGLNLFRLNGGCNIFESEQFYDLCDENGILVWQELPLCWHTGHGASRTAWRDQLTQTVLRLRQHPSLAVYVGGNEFQPYAAGVAPVLGLAREVFAAYDDRPFRMSSPGGGTHHAYGPWDMYSADPNWYVNLIHEGYPFVSEWSFPAFANMSLLKRVVSPEELARGPVGHDWGKFMESHPILHDRHSEVDFIGKYSFNRGSWYGDLGTATVPEFVEYSQMAQAEMYGYVFEHWRAHFPYKSGQTVWTYNTMAPVSSWNLIDWLGQPVVCFYAAKRAHETVHVLAKTPFLSWGPGDEFRATIFALNDRPQSIEGAQIKARLLDRAMAPVVEEAWNLTIPGGGIKSDPREVRWAIPTDHPEGWFFLELTLAERAGERTSRQVYCLRVVKALAEAGARRAWQSAPVPEPPTSVGPWLRPQIEGVPTSLEAKILSTSQVSPAEGELRIEISNRGPCPAYPVRLAVAPDTYSVLWDDNYFWLAPNESVVVSGTVRLDMKGLDPLTCPPVRRLADLTFEVSAWNAAVCRLKTGP